MSIQNHQENKADIPCMEENLSPEEMRREILRLREELAAERSQKDFFLKAIESLPNPIFIKDDQGNFVFFNQSYGEFFGINRQDFIGKSVFALPFLSEEERERYHQEDLPLIGNTSILHYEVDFVSQTGELCPSFYWSRGFVTPQSGEKGLVGEIVNISKERELEKKLKSNIEQLEKANKLIATASKIDTLTGVFNRSFLEDQGKLFSSSAMDTSASIYFLMLDLDHFKAVNDTYGHLAGDHVLMHFASILKDSCREKDIPIRYGGEEFLLFLYDVDLHIAEKIALRILNKCSQELKTPGGDTITVSIGISQYHPGNSLDDCIARADEALYHAKNTGRNKVVIEEGL